MCDHQLNVGDNEQRAIIQPQSLTDPLVKELFAVLIEWINDELADQRIIVKNIEEDLYDGQVLHKLWEKLSGRKLDVLEVTQSEVGQREKLQIVLNAVNVVSFSFYKVCISSNLSIKIFFSLLHGRLLVIIKKFLNGTLKVFIQRIWWPYYICSLHWYVISVLQFVCQKMFMSQL